MQWYQLDYMQAICTLVLAHKHTNTSSLTGRTLFLTPNQQCQSTEGIFNNNNNYSPFNGALSRTQVSWDQKKSLTHNLTWWLL